MPKIQAATVAEHRAAQRRALLDAARGILARGVVPTLAEVGTSAGLARPSVYQYFRSREDLLTAVLEDSFPRWSRHIVEHMDRAGDPAARVLAYIRANLDLVAQGEHDIARLLATVLPGDLLAGSTAQLHEQLSEPLIAALARLGAPDPDTTAELINAVVYAASRRIEQGSDAAAVLARAEELVGPFLNQHPR